MDILNKSVNLQNTKYAVDKICILRGNLDSKNIERSSQKVEGQDLLRDLLMINLEVKVRKDIQKALKGWRTLNPDQEIANNWVRCESHSNVSYQLIKNTEDTPNTTVNHLKNV